MIEEPQPSYAGAFVILEPIGASYRVRLDLPPGCDLSRTTATKDEAWAVAMCLWSAFGLPLRDLSVSNVARGADPD